MRYLPFATLTFASVLLVTAEKKPEKAKEPAAKAYEYYDPDKRAASRATRMTVTART